MLTRERNSPEKYIETTDASLRDTLAFVEDVVSRQSFKDGLVIPTLTPRFGFSAILISCPRFVPTCTPELMKGLGELAQKYDLPIQSHISENKDEVWTLLPPRLMATQVAWVSDLHPECKSYADVYDKYGLMTDKTIMAHAIYLTEEEKQLFAAKKGLMAYQNVLTLLSRSLTLSSVQHRSQQRLYELPRSPQIQHQDWTWD